MNNLSASVKKFLGNKNTVTILGVLLCIIVLYIGYNYRVNQAVSLVQVVYANQTIPAKTVITDDMVSTMNVPTSFLVGSYYSKRESVVGKYSNYNTIIAEGSLFYTDLVVNAEDLPDSAFADVPEGYRVVMLNVDVASMYANSIQRGDYIDLYFKATSEDGKLMFGRMMENIEVLDVKDSSGNHISPSNITEEQQTPAYLLFAVPEDAFLLIERAKKLPTMSVYSSLGISLMIVPNTVVAEEDDVDIYLSSADIEKYINEKAVATDVIKQSYVTEENTNNDDTEDNTQTNNNQTNNQ